MIPKLFMSYYNTFSIINHSISSINSKGICSKGVVGINSSLDFNQLVKSDLDRELVQMKAISDEEIEAKRMAEMVRKKKSVRRRYKYETVLDEACSVISTPFWSTPRVMSVPKLQQF